MKNSFECKKCRRQSISTGIEQDGNVAFVVCQHADCRAKNRLASFDSKLGTPLTLEIVGVIEAITK